MCVGFLIFNKTDLTDKVHSEQKCSLAYNVWCYEQVCVAPAANLLIARVSSWRIYLPQNLI
jgi:acyl-ACP thioesterase